MCCQTTVPMMRLAIAFTLTLLIAHPCISRHVSEDSSVVSVYTNQPTAAEGTRTSGVYLIASNIADRITSPISKFFGFGSTNHTTTTKRPFHRIELMDDTPETVTKADVNPAINEIPRERDVEELSAEGKAKNDSKRPEKITLFTSYLPNEKIKQNDTVNEIGSGDTELFGFDDDFDGDIDEAGRKPREGGIIYVLEVIGSVIQLLWGGVLALFTPSNTH